MTTPRTEPQRLRAVSAGSVAEALADALAGGPPIAPLPPDEVERRLACDMLRLGEPVEELDALAVLSTSGSTGRPKGVVLSRAAVMAAATATSARLGGPGDWVLALPTHYVAGLMVLARGLIDETAVHAVGPDLVGLPEVVATMSGRRYISLVPTQLVRACADPLLSAALAAVDAVLLGGAAAEESLLASARDRGIPVVTTYGMSETGGGCVYDGVPLGGVDVELEPSGRILIGGTHLFSGYRRQPELTRSVLRDGRFLTSDRGRWQGGRLQVLGRLDDVVVSGGINVDLAVVERAAREWPGLTGAELAVVGLPDLEWGTRVVAVTDGSGSGSDLRHFLRLRLPPAAAPRQLIRLPALPRTSSGKIDRQRLVRELSGVAATGGQGQQPDPREHTDADVGMSTDTRSA